MSAGPSRRSMFAAAATTNNPPTAATARENADVQSHPDAELLALGDRYQLLLSGVDLAEAAVEHCYETFRETRPPAPAALAIGNADRHDRTVPDGCSQIDGRAIEYVRRRRAKVLDAAGRLGCNPREVPRMDEMIAAWEAWQPAVQTARAAAGLDLAEEASQSAVDALSHVEAKIAACSATTIEGLAVKGAVLKNNLEQDPDADSLATRLLRSLIADLEGSAH